MPKQCKVLGCTNHNYMKEPPSFHRFPIKQSRLQLWVNALNRVNSDGTPWWPKVPGNVHVCGVHFVTGKPVNDPLHVDYVPTLLPNNVGNTKERGLKIVQRYERATTRSRTKNINILGSASPCLNTIQQTGSSTSSEELGGIRTEVPASSSYNDDSKMDDHQRGSELSSGIVAGSSLAQQSSSGFNAPVSISERESFVFEMSQLREERDRFKDEVDRLKKMQTISNLCANAILANDSMTHFMTGLSSEVLSFLYEHCVSGIKTKQLGSLVSPVDQMMVCLIYLRHNISLEYLAHQKSISPSTMSDIITRWIDILYTKISFLVQWPEREAMIRTLPAVFKKKFPRLTGIADCFEVFIERPSKLHARAQCYSNYKHHSTIKVFIVCSPLGCVSYLSTVWGGRASDVHIVRESDFISPRYHMPGDQILVDRGFTLKEDFASIVGVELLMPSFTKGKKQLTASDVDISRQISSVRIHIERVIGLVRNRYRILKGPLKISDCKTMVEESEASDLCKIDKIVRVCGALTNLGEGIVSIQQ